MPVIGGARLNPRGVAPLIGAPRRPLTTKPVRTSQDGAGGLAKLARFDARPGLYNDLLRRKWIAQAQKGEGLPLMQSSNGLRVQVCFTADLLDNRSVVS